MIDNYIFAIGLGAIGLMIVQWFLQKHHMNRELARFAGWNRNEPHEILNSIHSRQVTSVPLSLTDRLYNDTLEQYCKIKSLDKEKTELFDECQKLKEKLNHLDNKLEEKSKKYGKLLAFCQNNGVCIECGQILSHDIRTPFASCKCGTQEWSDESKFTPYMKLQKLIHRIDGENRDLRKQLDETLAHNKSMDEERIELRKIIEERGELEEIQGQLLTGIPMLRPCKWRGSHPGEPWSKGYFHDWCGTMQDALAIVEASNGVVHLIKTENFRFDDAEVSSDNAENETSG